MDKEEKTVISRRTILKALLACGLVVIVLTGLGFRYRRSLIRRYVRLRPDQNSGAGTLSSAEFEVIRALFEVISSKPAPSPDELFEYINMRTSRARGFFREYKQGVTLLEGRARKQFGASFAALRGTSQEAILREILERRSSFLMLKKARGYLGKFQLAVRLVFFKAESRFYTFVFSDLLRFYWSSSAGWTAVGYRSYPGVPDDPRAYTSSVAGESVFP